MHLRLILPIVAQRHILSQTDWVFFQQLSHRVETLWMQLSCKMYISPNSTHREKKTLSAECAKCAYPIIVHTEKKTLVCSVFCPLIIRTVNAKWFVSFRKCFLPTTFTLKKYTQDRNTMHATCKIYKIIMYISHNSTHWEENPCVRYVLPTNGLEDSVLGHLSSSFGWLPTAFSLARDRFYSLWRAGEHIWEVQVKGRKPLCAVCFAH